MSRPRDEELDRRTEAFRKSLIELGDLSAAASASRIDPGRVLRLTRESEWRVLFLAVLEGRIGPTAVVVDAPVPPTAARAA